MTKIEGYEDCHIVNENNPASLSVSTDKKASPDAQIASMRLHAAPVDAQDGGGESNGGEIRQGDASKEDAVDACRPPSTTRTRDELVEVMCRANTDHTVCGSDAMVYLSMEDCSSGTQSPNWQRHQYDMGIALDALIAIGAVRVK